MQEITFYFYINTYSLPTIKRKPVHVECAEKYNEKKINMSISFVYGVSIQGNCENAVFTFLPFYKQNIAFFLFLTYHCCVVDFGYSEGESLSYCTCRITFSTIQPQLLFNCDGIKHSTKNQ